MILDKMQQLCIKVYELEIESSSPWEATMLDLAVFKSHANDQWCISHKPHIKSSARHIPLNHSYHPIDQRVAWPIAEVIRMHQRSSNQLQSQLFRMLKIVRFSYFFLEDAALERCISWHPPLLNLQRRKDAGRRRTIWLVLPYHEAMLRVKGALRQVLCEWNPFLKSNLNFEVDVRVAWQKGGIPLMFKFRKL